MIETERLILRPPIEADLEPMLAMTSDPEVVRFIGGKPARRTDAWTRLMRNVGHWTLKGYGPLTIIEKATGRFVGDTGLAHFERGLGAFFDPFPEAGWILDRWTHGRGYATEAALAAHAWFDDQGHTPRTVCIIDPGNAASLRVAEKLGYQPFDRGKFAGDEVVMLARVRG